MGFEEQVVGFPVAGGGSGSIARVGVLAWDWDPDITGRVCPGRGLLADRHRELAFDIVTDGRKSERRPRFFDRAVVVNMYDVPDLGVDVNGRRLDGSSFGLALVIADFRAVYRAELRLPGLAPIGMEAHVVATGSIEGVHGATRVNKIDKFPEKLRSLQAAFMAREDGAQWVFLYPEDNEPGPGSEDHAMLAQLRNQHLRCHALREWLPARDAQIRQPVIPPPKPPVIDIEEPGADLPGWICPDEGCLERLGLLTMLAAVSAALLGFVYLMHQRI